LTFTASISIGALFARLGLEKDVKPLRKPMGLDEEPAGCATEVSEKGFAWRRACVDAWAFFVPAERRDLLPDLGGTPSEGRRDRPSS
jgi:hypothetical protein